jgi:hypothetical protein
MSVTSIRFLKYIALAIIIGGVFGVSLRLTARLIPRKRPIVARPITTITGNIDLGSLKNHDGRTLSSEMRQRAAMLIVVEPRCGACESGREEILEIRSMLNAAQFDCFVVSFTAGASGEKFFEYTDSKFPDGPAFLWNKQNSETPKWLFEVPTPSFLLIDNQGTINHSWVGINTDPAQRASTLEDIKDVAMVAMKERRN